jgi:Pin2-interacting protein X1
MMQAQGWQPGEYLGAKDANHAGHYTVANASHIRVLIKDDNLGIGAKIGSGVGHGECTGLDAFKNLLGRLNGKDEDEIKKEQRSREDLKRAIYTERKWGTIRFVKGGFLIGDKIQDLIEGEADRVRKLGDPDSTKDSDNSSSSSDSEEEAPAPVKKSKKSKKRKADIEEEVPEVVAIKEKKSKKKRKLETDPEQDVQVDDNPSEETEKKQRKKERQEKRERKQQKRELKASLVEESSKEVKKKSKKDKKHGDLEPKIAEPVPTKEITPTTSAVNSGRSTPMMQGRHAVRSRNIAQKRLASMDVASLNQVCSSPSFEYVQSLIPLRSS